jgi:hypothetical protein
MSKKKRYRAITYTFEQQHAENMARISLMSPGERRQRIRQLESELKSHRRSTKQVLNGGVRAWKGGFYKTSRQLKRSTQRFNLIYLAAVEEELRALNAAG